MEEKYLLLVKALDASKRMIATMESCTGGYIASLITNVSGASDVLKFSAVTYSSEYKIKMGVNKDTIDKYTVYSSNVAREMSKNIALFSNSNIGVGITGKMDEIEDENERLRNNKIYVSVYDRDSDKYYEEVIVGEFKARVENKKLVAERIVDLVKEVLES